MYHGEYVYNNDTMAWLQKLDLFWRRMSVGGVLFFSARDVHNKRYYHAGVSRRSSSQSMRMRWIEGLAIYSISIDTIDTSVSTFLGVVSGLHNIGKTNLQLKGHSSWLAISLCSYLPN